LIEEIFHEALTARESAREALIRARCGGNAALVEEITSLIEACEAEEQMTATRLSEPVAACEDHLARQRVGAYQIDRLLGRGGMGAVYLAHRADGQFDQQVAIKLIDLPLATSIFRERFRQERQILAGLQHPYIARLMDGGVTPEGDLYLAMEYVDGLPIHRYCEQSKLSVPERMALFLRVCDAVQFAHQNFVVHRDLKPDNILVVKDGTPRLLDFGTAKLLSPSPGAPGSELTREGYLSFTPQYASPEQVLGKPITTASDTYSLGVLFYVLMTGSQPYELKEVTTAEMLRVVCEEPPRRPSQVTVNGVKIDADLEAILLKALRKESHERYLTAEQLASDVRAYLGKRPVAARRGTLRYRAGKFVRRNQLALAGTALLTVTLATGIVGVVWQAKVANEQRRKAEARSADLRELSNSLLSELNDAIKELPGSTGVQKLLVTRVLAHLDRMARDARGDRQTQLDLATAYTGLSKIQGDPYNQNLGDSVGALASINQAISLASPLVTDHSRDREALQTLATAQEVRSEILYGAQRLPEAISDTRAAIRTYDRLISTQEVTAFQVCEAADSYNELGDEFGTAGSASLRNIPAALDAYRKDLDLFHRALTMDPNLTIAKRSLGIGQMKIGDLEQESDPAQALKDYRIAWQNIEALPAAELANLRTVRLRSLLLGRLASTLVELGDYSAANKLFDEALRTMRRLSAADPQDMRSLTDLQLLLQRQATGYEDAADPALAITTDGRRQNLSAAEKLLTELLPATEKVLKMFPGNEDWRQSQAEGQVRLGSFRTILQINANSATLLSKSGIATLKELADKTQASPDALNQAANALLKAQPETLRDAPTALRFALRAVTLSNRQTPTLLLTLAQAYRATGQLENSRATAKEGLALLAPVSPGGVRPRLRKLLELQTREKP